MRTFIKGHELLLFIHVYLKNHHKQRGNRSYQFKEWEGSGVRNDFFIIGWPGKALDDNFCFVITYKNSLSEWRELVTNGPASPTPRLRRTRRPAPASETPPDWLGSPGSLRWSSTRGRCGNSTATKKRIKSKRFLKQKKNSVENPSTPNRTRRDPVNQPKLTRLQY